MPWLIASCAPCDGPNGLATGNGSPGITVVESASAATTIAADFIRRFSPYYLPATLLAPAAITASRVSFDHLVGAGEKRRRHIYAKRLRCFHVDHQLKFRRL